MRQEEESMSVCNFIQRLLKIKAFSVKAFTFQNWFKELWLEVKPYKNGALCPHCMRRGKLIHTLDSPRVWRDIPVCGRLVFLSTARVKLFAVPMAVFKSLSHGRLHMPVSRIGLNTRSLFIVQS